MALEARRLLASPYEVENTADSGTGSLRSAVLAADSAGGSVTITFDPTVFSGPQTVQLTSGELLVGNANITIVGPGAGLLTVEGNGSDRIVQVITGASATISGMTITGGNTTSYGGGLDVESKATLTITGCTISGDTGKDGGAIYNGGTLWMTGCTLAGNSAGYGGGLWNIGKATLNGCTISGDSAVEGGGVLNDRGGQAYLTNCTIADNSASFGGGLSNYGRSNLTACTVSGNTASSTDLSVFNGAGGGIYNYVQQYGGITDLVDTIVAGNYGGRGLPSDIGGDNYSSVYGSYDLIGPGGSGGIANGRDNDIVLTDATKAGLGSLGDYGGPTATMPLLSGGAAIGQGASQSGVTTDQRGFALDAPVDIGAYQVGTVPLVVGSTGDNGVGVASGSMDLRGAVDLAGIAPAAATITFDSSVFATSQTITLTAGPLRVAGTMTIAGPAAGLSVSGGGVGGVFRVGASASATISGLTLTGGVAATGGGLYNLGTATLEDCAIAGDSATGNGGGVANLGVLDLVQCTIGGDTAGGVGGGLYNAGTASLVGCTISGDTAAGSGGGIGQGGSASAGVSLGDTIVAGNAGGGGLSSDIGGPRAANVVGTYNLVGTGGAGGLGVGTGNVVLSSLAGLGLSSLGDHGGGTPTFALLPGSPAIDAGSGALLPGGTSDDERGQPRIVGAAVDIGAFESQGFTMTTAVGGTPQAAMPGAAFGSPMAVAVAANHAGEPVAGGTVAFAVTPSGGAGASLSSTTATIAADGSAQVTATANATYGSYVVTATAAGAGTARFALTNLVPVAFSGLSNPSIAFGTASVTFSGTLSDGTAVPAGQSVALTFQGTTQSATIQADGSFATTFPNTGGLGVVGSPYTVSFRYSGDGTYGAASATARLTVTRVSPTVAATDAGGTYNGSTFAASATIAGVGGQAGATLENVGLTLTYYAGTSATGNALSGAPSTAGTYTVQASFAGSSDYAPATGQATFTIAQANPNVTWDAPASIVYGTVLSSAQLDATSTVPGSFHYTPAAGTVVGAGTQTLKATFTPNDTTDYATATAAVDLIVSQATPTIDWPSPAPIAYGTALTSAQLVATGSVPGTFVYSPPAGKVLTAGAQTLSVTFIPTDTTDYTTATATTTIDVTQATPIINWPSPAAIAYGTALGPAQLDATGSVLGTFVYSPTAGKVLTAGTQTLSVMFTPTDSTDYTTTTATVEIAVNRAAPSITWPAPASIVYGTALGSVQLDATGSVPGTFFYSPTAGTVLGAGAQTLTATFTPTDTNDYTTATATTTINVTRSTPTIDWPSPAEITYGTALTTTQLDARGSVPGTFSYSPTIGKVFAAGTQTLSATFTPADTNDYTTATATTTLIVTPSTPTVAVIGGGTYDGRPIPATATVAGIDSNPVASLEGAALVLTYYAGDTATGTPLAGPPTAAGRYTVSASFPGSQDYATAAAQAGFSIDQATPAIEWSAPASIVHGTALGPAQLDATSTVSGTFSYSPDTGAVPSIGTQTLTATFTPGDTTDYATVTATRNLTVTPSASSITWDSPSPIVHGTALSPAQLDANGSVPGPIVYDPPAGTILGVGTHTLTATLSPTDAVGYASSTATVTLVVDPIIPTIAWPAPAPIVYGTALGPAQLDASSPVLGTFAYTPAAGTVLGAGAQTLTATFTPTDTTDDTTATATVTLVVKATPAVAWGPPAPIVYGTPLGPSQLDATASVPGTFAYSIPAGTVLGAGTHTMTATFTPNDAADQATVSVSATIAVVPALPTVRVQAGGGTYDGSPFAAVATVAGAIGAAGSSLEGVAPVLTYFEGGSAMAGPPTEAGTYNVTASFPGSTDYAAATSAPVTFAIAPAASGVVLSVSTGSSVFGQPVELTAAVASPGTPTGSITFLDGGNPLGTAPLEASGRAVLNVGDLGPGAHAIAAVYTGDPDRNGGQSAASALSVGPADTRIVLVPHPVFRRKKLVGLALTVEVQPIAPGVGVPTGPVTLLVQVNRKRQQTLATAGLVGGQATLSLNPRSILNKPITLNYTGGPGFQPVQLANTRLSPQSLAALAQTADRISPAKDHPTGPIRRRLSLR